GPEEALLVLKPRFPEISGTDMRVGLARVQERLTPHQHKLLSRLIRKEIEADDIVDERPDPESQALDRERIEGIAREVERLPAEERLLVKLRFEKDLSLSQVAEVMGIETPQGVDRRLRKILSGLKRAFERGKGRGSSV
ncbi:MAG: RNA polymerase sigma factor, partial [Vicinamibacteria bacterium]